MAQNISGRHEFVDELLEEKDRLICEKDELVESKVKLWRAMHQMLLERDAIIQELEQSDNLNALRQENRRLVQRNQALEDALRGLLKDEDEYEDEEEDQEGTSIVYVVL